MNTTERRAVEVGQTWEGEFTSRRVAVLAKHERDGYWLCRYEQGGEELPVALGNSLWTLVSGAPDIPAPQPKPACGAPEGYLPCRHGCGRWTQVGSMMGCGKCCSMSDAAIATLDMPDWTPPLESKPAETVKEFFSCPVEGCDGVLIGTKPNIRCSKNCGAKPPAQEAPKAPVCGGCKREMCIGMYTSCRDSACRGELLDSALDRSLPEQLQRPKLAHSMGVEDPALEDA